MSEIQNPTSKFQNWLPRREALRLAAAGICSASASGWLPVLARNVARAAEEGRRHKSCILLWMSGGPSHLDTFDLKPGTPEGGEFRPIATSVPGIQISEHFPKLARLMNHGAIIRSMSTGEADHGRAGILMHTGRPPTTGGLKHPSLGAIVSAELGRPKFLLPNFVVCGQGNRVDPSSAGFLGPQHRGLVISDAAQGLNDLKPVVAASELDGRLDLLSHVEDAFRGKYRSPAATAHQATYQRAIDLMRSDQARAFDLSLEPAESRSKYGASAFGEGCLLARRLVESGVSLVEVVLPGWDTHQKNFTEVRRLSQVVDPAMSALIEDLSERGLLGSTLVIWMGEFGRTPRINNGGRDHYARAWSTVLMGGGIPGGQVIGRTDDAGATVLERPVSVADFMATICRILEIDATKTYEQAPTGRPVRIVAEGAEPIKELLST
jgi:Protein of unknown function (DUF1501)